MQRLLWSLAFSVFFGLVAKANGAVLEAKSASLSDVQAAIRAAAEGDTVTVPAGTATWTATLNITKNITLQGAGSGSTVIIDAVPAMARERRPESHRGSRMTGKQPSQRGPSGLRRSRPAKPRQRALALSRAKAPSLRSPTGRKVASPLISISLTRDLPFRMTGFTFKGLANDTKKGDKARIQLSGNSHAFRIDHCVFDGLQAVNVSINGFLLGVIDHCHFNLVNMQPIQVGHAFWNGGDHGNGSWADDSHWGSEKFVFIEDNVFDNTGRKRSIDAYQGARLVVRYNQFHNTGLSAHGTEGQGRGARAIEEYNNVYNNDQPLPAPQIRSGCIVTHHNKWSKVTKGHVLQAYRQFQRSPHWGIANGQNPYDDNDSNGSTGYSETGKHTGLNGATVLTDSTKNWAPNQWYVPGATYIVRNVTKEAAGDSQQSFAISNTTNTITCSSLSFTKTVLTFNTGDTYQIWRVIRSLDQPGLGKGDLLRGLPGRPAKWPQQVSEPCYSWNNFALEDGTARNLSSTEPSIKEGRDFFNETPKPGYTPYTYPHPLVSGELSPVRKMADDKKKRRNAGASSSSN
jgi:hypothetical protein